MNNPFNFDDEPCLQFLNQDSYQSNSLLANIGLKEQYEESMNVIQFNENSKEEFQQNQQSYQQINQNRRRENYQQSERPKNKTKQKKKVFYRDKMALLMNQQYIRPDYNYIDFAQFQKGKSPISRQQQLKRNRQSAKQSRQRKKQYMETLEEKITRCNKQVMELTQRLRQTELQRDRLKQSNNLQMQSFNQLRGAYFQTLSKLLNSQQSKQLQIEQFLNGFSTKFGSAGKDRLNLLNYYMNQIVQNILTDIQKYFTNCAVSNIGFFGSQQRKIDLELGQILNMNQLKKKTLQVKYKERYVRQALRFNQLSQQFYQTFTSMINQGSIMDSIFKDIKKEFDCREIARLVVWLQQNKFRKDMRRIRGEWVESFRKYEDEITDTLRKQTKIIPE